MGIVSKATCEEAIEGCQKLSEEDEPINEETRVPEQQGLLGGQSRYATNAGVRTLVRVEFCDRCHIRLRGEDYGYCECQRKICRRCLIYYEIENVYYCIDCVQERLCLSKREYLVLAGFERLSKRKEISEAARIKDKEAKQIVRHLAESGFLAKKNIFAPHELTHEGSVALAIYRQVYGEHPDVLEFDSRITQKELEREWTSRKQLRRV